MRYAIITGGESRSFPDGDSFLVGATGVAEAEVVFYLGTAAPPPPEKAHPDKAAVVVELGLECLAMRIGDTDAPGNILGFARYRNGSDAPSRLVELVRPLGAQDSAVSAARTVLERAGLAVSVCADQSGRIIDRLVRPKYNGALRFVDEGLATPHDLDLTCRLGLGYPDGPVERVVRGGLAYHHDVTKALFDAYGSSAYTPARRAIVAAARRKAQP